MSGNPGPLAIDVRKVSKRYRVGRASVRELWALRDVSFALAAGTILGVIGPNGAGKTTLLKVISRITPPTEGRVYGRGRVVPLLAMGAGFQADASARENILMNAAMYGIPAREASARIDRILEFAGVTEFGDFPLKRYSSGMYIRLAFAVAINMSPDVLLADEILAVGDLEFQEKCLERVKQAGREGMAVMFVSHDMEAITRLCDQVMWINAGEIVRIGDPAEIVAAYQNSAWALTGRSLKDSRSGSHRNAHGEIQFVQLTSPDGREIGAARTQDEVQIRIGFELRTPGVLVRPTAHFLTRGVVAFRSRPVEDLPYDRAGRHTLILSVPANLLAPTIYSLNLDLVIQRDGEWLPLSANNALSFQVFDPNAAQRDHIGGVVSPRLAWARADPGPG